MGERKLLVPVLLLIWLKFALSCVYFFGDSFFGQTLVILKEREQYCVLPKTTIYGHPVPCAGDVTATRVNDTCVLLNTEEGEDVAFILNYGKDNEKGKDAITHRAACPVEAKELKKTEENGEAHFGVWVIVIVIVFVITAMIIISWAICTKGKAQRGLNEKHPIKKTSNEDIDSDCEENVLALL